MASNFLGPSRSLFSIYTETQLIYLAYPRSVSSSAAKSEEKTKELWLQYSGRETACNIFLQLIVPLLNNIWKNIMHNLYENGMNVLYFKKQKKPLHLNRETKWGSREGWDSQALLSYLIMNWWVNSAWFAAPGKCFPTVMGSSDDKISVICRFSLFLCFSVLWQWKAHEIPPELRPAFWVQLHVSSHVYEFSSGGNAAVCTSIWQHS